MKCSRIPNNNGRNAGIQYGRRPTPFSSVIFRQLLGNGTLYFPPFLVQDFRAEVHNARYRCRATSSVGTVLSREVTLRAGEFEIPQNFPQYATQSYVSLRPIRTRWSSMRPWLRYDVQYHRYTYRDNTHIISTIQIATTRCLNDTRCIFDGHVGATAFHISRDGTSPFVRQGPA